MLGFRTRVRSDLKTADGKRSWAAGHWGLVVAQQGDRVRVKFESCGYCTLPNRCQAVHWIKVDDLALRNGLDVVFDFVP